MLEEAEKAISEFGAEVTALGCGEMMGFSEEMSKILEVLVIDPLLITVKTAETLATLGLRHSRAYFHHTSSRR